MKLSVIGLPGIKVGKHNVKDPRLDQVDKLVEAKKKTYVQVDVVAAEEARDAEALIVSADAKPDLILADMEFVETRLSRDPGAAEKEMLTCLQSRFEAGEIAFGATISADLMPVVSSYQLATLKPIIVAESPDAPEDDLVLRAYHACGYACFLTVGGKENRAWQIRKGATAWEAAGSIHTDIQKGFIRAEIISYEDLVQTGGETQAKRAGKMRLETKDYVMQDCDITNFRFNK